jgi:glycosyltransferase AglD
MKILIAIPAYNEAKILEQNVTKVAEFTRTNFLADQFKIIIADNNSKDNTRQIADTLKARFANVDYLFEPRQGKGFAIASAWQKFPDDYDIYVFLDADLATDLVALPDLIKALQEGNEVAIGCRYLQQSQVVKSISRRIFSFCYRLMLKILLKTKIKDMPCGFKAISRKVLNEIVPLVENHTWFFDTELVYLAEKRGFKIKEIPVKWREPRSEGDKSRVSVIHVSRLYIKEALRLKKRWSK